MKTGPLSHTIQKKSIPDGVETSRSETTIVGNNIGQYLPDVSIGKKNLKHSQKAQIPKGNVNNLNCFKIKNLCLREERQFTEQEKILQTHRTKEPMSKLY